MNGSAQKTRRWTKGGSLPQSVANAISHPSANQANGARHTVVPTLRDVIAELFSTSPYARDRNDLKHGTPHATEVRATSPRARPSRSSAVGSGVAEMAESSAQFPRWKRLLDLVLIFATVPVWLPLMTVVTIVIKVGSPGPVFYRQERVGYRGKLFMIFKFRSMKVDAETTSHERHLATLIDDNSPMTKLDATGDPRLVPLGRLLRATGLDELPQIFNVIRGEMSLVGPRPCLPYEFQRYEPWQQGRVNAAPGLTGYWQVNGKNKTTFAEMIDMDIFYSKNMSLGLDLTIMLKTIPAIIQQVREAQSRARSRELASPSMHGRSPALAGEGEPDPANL
jgi:exopolysaccharide production protein ExoY